MARIRRQLVWRHVLATLLCGIGFLGGIASGDEGSYDYIPNAPELYVDLLRADIVVIGTQVGDAKQLQYMGMKYQVLTVDVEEWMKGKPAGEVTEVKVIRRMPGIGSQEVNPTDPTAKDKDWLAKRHAFGNTLRHIPDKAAGVFILKKHEMLAAYYPSSWKTPLPFLAGDALEAQLKVLGNLRWSEPVNGLSFAAMAGSNYMLWSKADASPILRVKILIKNVSDEKVKFISSGKLRMVEARMRRGNGPYEKVNLYPEVPGGIGRTKYVYHHSLPPGGIHKLQYPDWVEDRPMKSGEYTLKLLFVHPHPDLLKEGKKDVHQSPRGWNGAAKLVPVRIVVNEETLKEPFFGGFRAVAGLAKDQANSKEKN